MGEATTDDRLAEIGRAVALNPLARLFSERFIAFICRDSSEGLTVVDVPKAVLQADIQRAQQAILERTALPLSSSTAAAFWHFVCANYWVSEWRTPDTASLVEGLEWFLRGDWTDE